jgi:hypothetical protein
MAELKVRVVLSSAHDGIAAALCIYARSYAATCFFLEFMIGSLGTRRAGDTPGLRSGGASEHLRAH